MYIMTDNKKATMKLRKWFFTIWNMKLDWEELYSDYQDIIRYLIVQKEKAPKTGRLHWQGAIHFYNPKQLSTIRRLLNLGKGEESGDLRPQRGSNKQVKDYCHKAKTSVGFQFEFGKPSQQGLRTDLEDIKARIIKEESDYSIMGDHFGSYMRYYKGFQFFRAEHLKSQSFKYRSLDVEFLSGPTACGKTSKAYQENETKDIFKINCSDGLKWFDGYTGQKVLILDEFKNQIQLTRMLDLLDGHQCRLEFKGGMTYALWTKVYITTNLRREDIYPNIDTELLAPLWRRVTSFTDFYGEKKSKENRNEVTLGNTETKVTQEDEKSDNPQGLSLESSEEDTPTSEETTFLDFSLPEYGPDHHYVLFGDGQPLPEDEEYENIEDMASDSSESEDDTFDSFD